MLSGVYKILNKVNGKIYIGSSINLNKRELYHLWELRIKNHSNEYLQRSFIKYGKDSFSFEIIDHCIPEKCIDREQFYINWYLKNGFDLYNICKKAGSVLGRKMSEETKIKIGLANSKQRLSEERKEHLRKINAGKKLPEAVKAKIGASQIGKKMSEEAKRKIAIAILGSKKSDAHRKAMSDAQLKSNVNGRRIGKYDLDGNLVCVYDKIIHAAKDVNSAYRNIFHNLSGERPTVRGFVFKYI